jgi:hypothetical protein
MGRNAVVESVAKISLDAQQRSGTNRADTGFPRRVMRSLDQMFSKLTLATSTVHIGSNCYIYLYLRSIRQVEY